VSSWRAVADLDLCQAHQMCQSEAPEVFGFDAGEDKVVVLDEHPADARKDAVRQAVRYCPAAALSLVEADPLD
jgi:ferredoxin